MPLCRFQYFLDIYYLHDNNSYPFNLTNEYFIMTIINVTQPTTLVIDNNGQVTLHPFGSVNNYNTGVMPVPRTNWFGGQVQQPMVNYPPTQQPLRAHDHSDFRNNPYWGQSNLSGFSSDKMYNANKGILPMLLERTLITPNYLPMANSNVKATVFNGDFKVNVSEGDVLVYESYSIINGKLVYKPIAHCALSILSNEVYNDTYRKINNDRLSDDIIEIAWVFSKGSLELLIDVKLLESEKTSSIFGGLKQQTPSNRARMWGESENRLFCEEQTSTPEAQRRKFKQTIATAPYHVNHRTKKGVTGYDYVLQQLTQDLTNRMFTVEQKAYNGDKVEPDYKGAILVTVKKLSSSEKITEVTAMTDAEKYTIDEWESRCDGVLDNALKAKHNVYHVMFKLAVYDNIVYITSRSNNQ